MGDGSDLRGCWAVRQGVVREVHDPPHLLRASASVKRDDYCKMVSLCLGAGLVVLQCVERRAEGRGEKESEC